jgi:glycolate oxidase FAD binding subunit
MELDTLKEIVGEGGVQSWEHLSSTWQAQLERTVTPASPIVAMVCPATPAQLSEVMAIAQANRWRVLPAGGGSKLDWGGMVGKGQADPPLLVISTAQLNRLIDHARGDLTVTMEAGMRLADLQATLAQAGQFLAIDPAFPAQATIGGVVATADTGSLRQRYGGVRDMLLGISLVRADGEMAKAGGRVVKNVAGYDLMKLFTGSYGTLGIMTELTFRVYPLPAASRTVVLMGEADAIAQTFSPLLNSALTPTHLDLLSPALVQSLGLGKEAGLAVRFQSIPASIEEQCRQLLGVGQNQGLTCLSLEATDEAALWEQLRERMTAPHRDDWITCKIGVRAASAVTALNQIEQISPDGFVQVHLGSGLGRLALDAEIAQSKLLKIRSLLQVNGGFLSILQAPIALKQSIDVWGYSGNALELMQRIKQQFDPSSRLSPHRFVNGI